MERRGSHSTRERSPWARSVAVAALVGAAASALYVTETGDQTSVAASLLFVGGIRQRSGLVTLVGWLLGGSLLGAALGYAATAWLGGVPVATSVGVGLGLALGGGVGAVSNLLAEDARDPDDAAETGESMTVDMEADDSPAPQPADLFDDHPDPVLYVADQGHGPVVLAANDAFARTFDVPGEAMSGTPLDEALLTTSDDGAGSAGTAEVVDAVADAEAVETLLTCRTSSGPAEFRLQTVASDADGYVLYTPTDADA